MPNIYRETQLLSKPLNGHTRLPRVSAEINGQLIQSVLALTLHEAASHSPNSFDITINTSVDFQNHPWLHRYLGVVSVSISIDDGESGTAPLLFKGLADHISLDPLERKARLRGRDNSAILSTSSPRLSFANQTSSEIAKDIAARHGLVARCFDTIDIVGSYRNGSYSQMFFTTHSQFKNEWDLLTSLAIHEDFELYMDGVALVFSPISALDTNIWPLSISELTNIKIQKVCALTDRIRLEVRSWNSDLNEASYHIVNEAADSTGIATSFPLEHLIVKPNMSQADIERLAQRYISRFRKRQSAIFVTMPANNFIRTRDTLLLSGVGAGYDTRYLVDSVRRRFSPTVGFLQYIKASPIMSEPTASLYVGSA